MESLQVTTIKDYIETYIFKQQFAIHLAKTEHEDEDEVLSEMLDYFAKAYGMLRKYRGIYEWTKVSPMLDNAHKDLYTLYKMPPYISIHDIRRVISTGPLSGFFPQTSQLQPLMYALVNSYGGMLNLGTFTSLITFLRGYSSMLGLFPTWWGEIKRDPETGYDTLFLRVTPFPKGPIAVFYIYDPFKKYDKSKLLNMPFNVLQLDSWEADWVSRYTGALFAEEVGRLRTRYGTEIPMGIMTLKLDGDKMLDKAAEKEKLEEELLSHSDGAIVSFM